MKVESNVYPKEREFLQGKVFVNFNVEEVTKENNGEVVTHYTYEQLRLPLDYSEEAITKAVDKRKEELKVTSISAVQARLMMNKLGLREAVEAAVSTNQNYKDYWEYSTIIVRTHPVLVELAKVLGLTDEDLDTYFMEGSKL